MLPSLYLQVEQKEDKTETKFFAADLLLDTCSLNF